MDDVDFIRTDYSLPLVKITETYTPTDTTFSGKVAVDSTTTVTAVWAETTAGGTTITTNLVAGTGEQDFTVTGLQPFTKYHLVCKATNLAGTGVSQTIYFTTAQQQEQPVEASVQILKWGMDKANNDTKCNEMVEVLPPSFFHNIKTIRRSLLPGDMAGTVPAAQPSGDAGCHFWRKERERLAVIYHQIQGP